MAQNILFINFSHYELTPIDCEEDSYVRRFHSEISLNDPTNGKEIKQVVDKALSGVGKTIIDALTNGYEVIIALPGASMVAAAVTAGYFKMTNQLPTVIAATKTSKGYLYKLREDRLLNLKAE